MLTGKIDLDHKRNFQGEILCRECDRPIKEGKEVEVWHGTYHRTRLDKIEQQLERRV